MQQPIGQHAWGGACLPDFFFFLNEILRIIWAILKSCQSKIEDNLSFKFIFLNKIKIY